MAKVTVADIQRMKVEGRKIAMMTAYYYEMARIIDRAEPDMILVGDSGGPFLLGHPDTEPTTMEEMILMTRSVSRGVQHALVVGDLPFMSYQVSVEEAVRNAGRLVKEARCDAVKPEGGAEIAEAVAHMTRIGIQVLGHMGLTPMTSAAFGGMTSGAKLAEDKVWADARALQEAGAFAIILTGITPELAGALTKELRIPTISGYGAGDACNGDIGVSPGTLGWTAEQIDNPRARYGQIAKTIYEGARAYIDDVHAGKSTRGPRT
jgi:3-methyl-2-oxobutanoate hydroxymethyltransferase